MILLLKIALLLCLIAICYQDSKDRLVYWFLFPLVGMLMGALHGLTLGWESMLLHTGMNMLMTLFILGILWTYNRFRFRDGSFTDYFGLGDVLFLLAIALAFAPLAFITLLVFGLLFSLVLHWMQLRGIPQLLTDYLLSRKRTLSLNKEINHSTIPLAGYLALFYGVAYLGQWLGLYNQMYIL